MTTRPTTGTTNELAGVFRDTHAVDGERTATVDAFRVRGIWSLGPISVLLSGMSTPVLSDKTTHGIRVGATAAYAADESDPAGGRYVFRYTVIIANVGDAAAKLVSRHWVIIDGDGKREDVEGPGVVGRTPRLGPGQSFRYQSYCPLPTPWGTMEGTYHLVRDDGATFDAAVDRFYLRGSADGSPPAAGDEPE